MKQQANNDNDTSSLRQHSQLVHLHLDLEGKCERPWPYLRRDSSSESKHPQNYHDHAGSVAAMSNAFATFVVDIPPMRWRKMPQSLEMQMMRSVSPCGKKYLAAALTRWVKKHRELSCAFFPSASGAGRSTLRNLLRNILNFNVAPFVASLLATLMLTRSLPSTRRILPCGCGS